MKRHLLGLILCIGLVLSACTTSRPKGSTGGVPTNATPSAICRVKGLPAETRKNILKLNAEHVTEQEVRDVLAHTPAPQIISIHGGIFPIKSGMNSFAQ